MSAVLVALSFVPGLAVVAWHLRERAKLRRLEIALDEERQETVLSYLEEDEITQKRESFSNWPMGPRRR